MSTPPDKHPANPTPPTPSPTSSGLPSIDQSSLSPGNDGPSIRAPNPTDQPLPENPTNPMDVPIQDAPGREDMNPTNVDPAIGPAPLLDQQAPPDEAPGQLVASNDVQNAPSTDGPAGEQNDIDGGVAGGPEDSDGNGGIAGSDGGTGSGSGDTGGAGAAPADEGSGADAGAGSGGGDIVGPAKFTPYGQARRGAAAHAMV